MEQQTILEKELTHKIEEEDSYSVEFEAIPPQPCSEFQTARSRTLTCIFLALGAKLYTMNTFLKRMF